MTPKEKATQIFDSMKGFRVKHSHSKKCAKNAVELLISSAETFEQHKEYWNEVRKEISLIQTP